MTGESEASGRAESAQASSAPRGGPEGRRIGSRIGHIRLEELIGEGGMGSVYAGWDEKLERRVAVKAVSPAYRLDAQARSRFLSEARILSKLQHPNICQIHELLESGEGKEEDDDFSGDHLVLELVEGKSLRRILRDDPPDADRAMDIALQLTTALAAAHEKGIVHRDLKPGNVMITDDGTVKVLDFGLALSLERVVEQRSARAGLEWTESGHVARPEAKDLLDEDRTLISGAGSGTAIEGTLAYMSPEQARSETATPASDMYSLGILLHELFTGRRAYEKDLGLPAQLVRVGRAETLPAEGIDADLARLVERLKSRAPGSRPSAQDVAERLRWIRDKSRRRARRLAAIAFVALVTIFAVVMAYQRMRIAEEAERANREAEAARQVSDFLVDLFEVSDPWNTESGDVTARQLLERGTRRIRGELEDQPATRARLLGTMGEVYRGLGLYDEARPLLEEAVELRRTSDADPAEVAEGLGDLARLESDLGDWEAAEALFHEALEIRRQALGEEVRSDPEHAHLLHWLGFLHYRAGDYEEALEVLERALERRRAVFGARSLEAAETLGDLGLVHEALGDTDTALDLQHQALDIRREILPEDHVLLGVSYANLASLHYHRGDYDRAVPLFERDLEIAREALGPSHPDVAISHNNLAAVLRQLGRFEDAEPHSVRSLDIRREVLGEDHASTAVGHYSLAGILFRLGRVDTAREHYLRALEVWRQALGEAHPHLGSGYSQLAVLEEAEERYATALEHGRRSLVIRRNHFGPDHTMTLDSLRLVARLELAVGNADAARSLAKEALETIRTGLAEHPDEKRWSELLVAVHQILGDAADELGDPAEARAHWESALEVARPLADSSDMLLHDRSILWLLLRLDREAEARAHVRELEETQTLPPSFVESLREIGLASD